MTTMWTPETWRSVPAFSGKVATEADFLSGGAIFYQRAQRIDAIHMPLPQPALLTTDNQIRAVLIVQAERAERPDGPVDLFGAFGPDGARFVFTSSECRLVKDSDPTWRRFSGNAP
jgi:hypothetical protein